MAEGFEEAVPAKGPGANGGALRATVLFWAGVFFYIAGLVLFLAISHDRFRRHVTDEVDRGLLQAASGVKYVLPEDYHDRARDESSIPTDEVARITAALDGYTRQAGLKWVYTAVRLATQVVFTASNPDENGRTFHFEPYDTMPPAFASAFRAAGPVFVDYTDRWGAVRSALVPETSPGGRPYVACADRDLREVEAFVRGQLLRNCLTGLGLFFLPVPLIAAYFLRSARQTRALERRNREATEEIARRREAEQKLEEIRRFNQKMMLSTPNLLYVFDLAQQRFTFQNHPLEHVLGYELGELGVPGDHIIPAVMHPDDLAGFPALVKRWETAGDHDVLTAEFRLRAKDGSWRWFDDRAAAFRRDAAGRVTHIIGTTLDITAHKQAAAALQASALTRQQVLDGVHDAIFIQEVETAKVIDVNARACELYGYAREELLQLGVDELSEGPPAFDWTTVLPLWEKAVAGEPQIFEWRPRARDGRVFWALVAIRRASIDGRDCILVAVRDIDLRKRAEEKAREAERRLAAIIDRAPLGAHLYDLQPDGRLVLVGANAAADRILGLDHHPLLGCTIEEAFPTLAGTDIPGHYREVAETGRPFERDVVEYRDNQIAGAFDIAASQIAPGRMVAMFRDVTERRRTEEQRRAFERQLLEHQRLESLGMLAGGIAHDFNNILMTILGNTSLALMDLPADSPLREGLGQIEAGARRAADLCNQMLAYAGRGRFVVQPLDLNVLVRDLAHMIEIAVPSRVRLRYALAPDLPSLEADGLQLRRALMNLVVNAAESIAGDGGEVEVRTGSGEAEALLLDTTQPDGHGLHGPCVFVEVSDNGAGIGPAALPRLFDPFFSTKFTGRGLGLPAVLGIVRGHKGAVTFSSRPGRGTVFRLVLRTSALAVPPHPVEPPPAAAPPRHGAILFVDDEHTVLNVSRLMLERAGFRVLTAEDGRKALDLYRARAGEIAAVVLDLTMPGLSGEQCMEEMQRIRPDVRVLLTSGYSATEVSLRFAGRPLPGFLQKPYSMDELVARVRQLVS